MSPAPPERRALEALLRLPDEAIDLAQAALLIARQEYPDLQVDRYLTILDEMGDEARSRLRAGEDPASRIAHLSRFLFEDLGFRGNLDEFYDPRNSFLNDVLDRRVGIPISLSAVYLEIGRRCGLPLAGVSFPGHFLVRYAGPGAEVDILIDPYHRGAILTRDDCRRRLEERFGGRVAFRDEFFRRARNREILERMLGNLKSIYEKDLDFHRALRVQNSLLVLRPGAPAYLRDRGLFHSRISLLAEAATDFEAYLAAMPQAPDGDAIRREITRLRILAPVMN